MIEMQPMGNGQNREVTMEYYQKVLERLRSSGFRIVADVQYRGQTFAYVARKTTFEIEKLGFAETFFVFAEFDGVDLTALSNYSKACFAYTLSKRRIPLPRGLLRMVFCYSVVLTHHADADVVEAVKNAEPPKHFSAFEFPVICDLASGQLYYSGKTPNWGSWYWDYFRNISVEMLSPKKQVAGTVIANNATPDTAVEVLSPKKRLRARVLESQTDWVWCPELYRWQYWARFMGAMLLLGSMAVIALGLSFGFFVMGIFSSVVAVSPYWEPARRLTLKIIGASDRITDASGLHWPLPLLRTIVWRVLAAMIAAVALFFIYLGIKELLDVGFSGQNVFLRH